MDTTTGELIDVETKAIVNSSESYDDNTGDFTTLSSNDTISADLEQNTCFTWITLTTLSIVPLLLVIGLFGNTFTIIIMTSKRFRSYSTSVYLSALALSDLAFILTFPFVKSTTFDLFGRDVKAISDFGCKLFYCVFRSAKTCSSWFVVLISFERFLVVWFPLKAKDVSNKRVAMISTVVVVLVIVAFEGSRTTGTVIVDGLCLPYYDRSGDIQFVATMIIISIVIYGVIPSIILLCCTPLTMVKLYYHYKRRREMVTSTFSDETFRVTVMLLTVTIAYIILVIPIAVGHAMAFFQGDSIFISTEPRIVIFREVAQILEQLNYVINFWLYVISNPSFRSHFCKILECRQTADYPGQVHRNIGNYRTALKTISQETSN